MQERQLPKGAARGILKNFGFGPAWVMLEAAYSVVESTP
jgi:hypothetical protein